MKFTKFMVLIAGVFSLIAFFVPYGMATVGGMHVRVSAFDLVKGVEKVSDISNVSGTSEDDAKLAAQSNDETTKGYAFMIFGPSLLLLVIGGIAVARKKIGRLAGVGCFLFGAWGAGMGALLQSAMKELGVDAGMGTYLLLGGGVLGLIAGILILIKPDRGPVAV